MEILITQLLGAPTITLMDLSEEAQTPGTGLIRTTTSFFFYVTFRFACFSHVSGWFFMNRLLGTARAQAEDSSSMQLHQIFSCISQDIIAKNRRRIMLPS